MFDHGNLCQVQIVLRHFKIRPDLQCLFKSKTTSVVVTLDSIPLRLCRLFDFNQALQDIQILFCRVTDSIRLLEVKKLPDALSELGDFGFALLDSRGRLD